MVLFGIFALGCTVVFMVGGVFLLWASTLTLPTIDIIEAQRAAQSTKIYDRTGEVLLYDMHQDIRRTVVELGEMSDSVKHATIAIEDDGFYDHYGIEPFAIVRAIVRNLQDGDLFGGQGGSTLTQQVVKNLLLVSDKKISRKLKEWVLALKLERVLTKDEILALYLNEAPYGGTKYGVEEASQGFFGKSAKDLTVAESAYLAALPQAPTYYSPYGSNRDALEARKNTVLAKMHEQGYLGDEELDAARNEEVTFRPFTSATIKAPHFVFYVLDQLQEMYKDIDIAQANLRVTTTLDWELQKEAEAIVYEKAMENAEKFDATNASLMAIDTTTGGILVMVGSRDYFDEEIDGNFNIGLALRQPGSSFKPFAYAAALEKGYTTETMVYDVRTQFSTGCDKTEMSSDENCYAPVNYDNEFRGPMTFRNALAQSVNVPAVKAMYLAGMKETYTLAQRMGISTLDDYQRYGLTLVLGGGEVSLLEMTEAYATFANDGYRIPHTSILEIRGGDGKTQYTYEEEGEEVLEVEIARSITNILADNNARTPAFGSNSYLHFPERDVAAKTGTTNDYRDAWIIGYTPELAVGAWAGNNDNSEMDKKVAGFIIAPMWHAFLEKYFELYPESGTFEDPEPLDTTLHPMLRGVAPSVIDPGFASSTPEIGDSLVLAPHSLLHYINKDDPRGPAPQNPSLDAQYPYWEYGVLLWRMSQGTLTIDDILNPEEVDEESTVRVRITEPDENEKYDLDEVVETRVRTSVDDEDATIERVLYYMDGVLTATYTDPDRRYEFMPGELALEPGEHSLTVVAHSTDGARGGATVDFIVRD